ncbi:MAG: hypothetical protein KGO02_06370 [Alphaproteobacteria bacterium]|nr:hypothetical protein [Alphaproteobacteria bacterium]
MNELLGRCPNTSKHQLESLPDRHCSPLAVKLVDPTADSKDVINGYWQGRALASMTGDLIEVEHISRRASPTGPSVALNHLD